MISSQKNNTLMGGQGYIHVYTGNGKGKTTAALGLAFRAMGRGLQCYIAQFMKGLEYGEILAAAMVSSYITIEQFGTNSPVHICKEFTDADKRMAQNGLSAARNAMLSGNFNIIILDEIHVAHYYQLVTTQDILDFIAIKPIHIELILTGRYAAEEIIQVADLVTDMQEVKHYFQKGILAREGIDR